MDGMASNIESKLCNLQTIQFALEPDESTLCDNEVLKLGAKEWSFAKRLTKATRNSPING